MKILFIHINFPCQFMHFVEYLLKNHEIKVVTYSQGDRFIYNDQIEVFRFPRRQVNYDEYKKMFQETGAYTHKILQNVENGLYTQAILKEVKKTFEPNIIISHDIYFDSYFTKQVFPLTKLVVRMDLFHGSDEIGIGSMKFDKHKLFNPEGYNMQKKIENITEIASVVSADAAFCATKFERDTFPERIRSLINVIFDGIDTEIFKPKRIYNNIPKEIKLIGEKQDYIFYPSRSFEPLRGFCQFFRSIPKIIQKYPKIKIVLVGDSKSVTYGQKSDTEKTWKEVMMEEIKVPTENLIWLDLQSHEVLHYLMEHSKLYIYLTYPWVLSWSMIEAMSMQSKIIASNVNPVKEFITHKKEGFLVDVNSVDSIANGILYGLEYQEEMKKMGQFAREKVVKECNKELMAIKFEQFLQKIC